MAEADAMPDNDDHQAYYQEITRMDALVGRMIEKLKALGHYDNTLIVLSLIMVVSGLITTICTTRVISTIKPCRYR